MLERAREYKTNSYTIKDFYNSYLDYTIDNELKYIDYNTFRKILIDYFKHISDEVIDKGKPFVLPGRCGEISVKKCKTYANTMPCDFKSSKELGKAVWHFNEHTDGYRYKFYWYKAPLYAVNSTKYQMIFTRHNKRRLASILNNGVRDYIEK